MSGNNKVSVHSANDGNQLNIVAIGEEFVAYERESVKMVLNGYTNSITTHQGVVTFSKLIKFKDAI